MFHFFFIFLFCTFPLDNDCLKAFPSKLLGKLDRVAKTKPKVPEKIGHLEQN